VFRGEVFDSTEAAQETAEAPRPTQPTPPAAQQ
jgi:hypothetical protein